VVTGDPNGAAIAGARVALLDGPQAGRSATADSAGAFAIASLTQAGFNVRFSASGYTDEVRGISLDRDVRLDVRLRAIRMWALSGTVLDDSNGRAVSGATVQILDGVSQGRSATTSGSGTFSISGIAEGGFNIRASASGFQNNDRAIDLRSNVSTELRLRPVQSAPAPGSGARVIFESRSACGCTMGGSTISLRLNGNVLGTMSCSAAPRTFDVAPGRYRINACDPSGDCWQTEDRTLAAGDEYRYVMTCNSTTLRSFAVPKVRQ
jgi:hypothetical protein